MLTYKTKHCIGLFTRTCKTKHTTDGPLSLQDRKNVMLKKECPRWKKLEKSFSESGRLLGAQQ